MKKLFALITVAVMAFALVSGVFAADLHGLSDEEQKRAEELIASAQAHAPEVSNEPVTGISS